MEKRKDTKGRNLKDNESQMSDGRYRFRYTDKNGKRTAVYSWKLVSTDKVPDGKRDDGRSLRQKEKDIERDLQDGIDSAAAENTTLNQLFDKYSATKIELKRSTSGTYQYCYDLYVRDTIGNRKIKLLTYSDMKTYFTELLKQGLSVGTLCKVNTLLYPVFTLAVRDGIIRNNTISGIVADLKKKAQKPEARHALTKEETRLFMDFLETSPVHHHWKPLFTFMLGTGCRVGEVIGITWKDIDFKNGVININHNLQYHPDGSGHMAFYIDTPKTEAGIREIPLLPEVRAALNDLQRQYFRLGIRCTQTIDGYTDFVFLTANGTVYTPSNINRALDEVINGANARETEAAKKENREPELIRHFSAHNLRHTFCTRLCEVESNLKLIMLVMGHNDVQTTMNIYNEIQEAQKKESFEGLKDKLRISA